MDHEDNTQFANNYLRANIDEFSLQQNQQNLVENRQIASGFGAGGIVGVVDEIGLSIGGKFEEEEHDEEEWKYIQEVQQSEKQQVMKVGEEVGAMDGVGRFVDFEIEGGDGLLLQPVEVEDEGEAAVIKNDGDFSTTSNTTSTTVGEEDNLALDEEPQEMQLEAIVETDAPSVVQMEMESEATRFLAQDNYSPAAFEEGSLATGENCENLQQQHQPHQQLQEPQTQQHCVELHEQPEKISGYMFSSSSPFSEDEKDGKYEKREKREEDKENADPAVVTEPTAAAVIDSPDIDLPTHTECSRPCELDIEMLSNLNPEAKEFVPIHSNPMSPTTPPKSQDIFDFGDPSIEQKNGLTFDVFGDGDNKGHDEFVSNPSINDGDDKDSVRHVSELASSISPHPNVPRHLIIAGSADDVLAQSPRKGRGSDMDAISLPAENEFDHEAAKRPHEIEQEDDDLVVDSYRKEGNEAEVDMNGMEKGNGEIIQSVRDDDTGVMHSMQTSEETIEETIDDYSDFQNSLDHGPETSVDLDMDSQNIMIQSFYAEETNIETQSQHQVSEQPIEEVLNSVQPIPGASSESLNSSFAEDLIDVANKELLYVEEKEVVSNSPSTEELQYQFQHDLDTFMKDVPKVENEKNAQELFNTENVQSSIADTNVVVLEPEDDTNFAKIAERSRLSSTEDNKDIEKSCPMEYNEKINENELIFSESAPRASVAEELKQFSDFSDEKVAEKLTVPTSSYLSSDKQRMEDKNENDLPEDLYYCEQQMDDLLLGDDGNIRKLQDVAQSATPITKQVTSSDKVLDDLEVNAPITTKFIEERIYERESYNDQILNESEQQNRPCSPSPLSEERGEEGKCEEEHICQEKILVQMVENINQKDQIDVDKEADSREVCDEIETRSNTVDDVNAALFKLSLLSEKPVTEVKIEESKAVSSPVQEVEASISVIESHAPEVPSTFCTTEQPPGSQTESPLLEENNPFICSTILEGEMYVKDIQSPAPEAESSVVEAETQSSLFAASYLATDTTVDQPNVDHTPQVSPAEASTAEVEALRLMPEALTLDIAASAAEAEHPISEDKTSIALDEAPTPEVEAPLIVTKGASLKLESPASEDKVFSSPVDIPVVPVLEVPVPITEASPLMTEAPVPLTEVSLSVNEVPASTVKASVFVSDKVPTSMKETSNLMTEIPSSVVGKDDSSVESIPKVGVLSAGAVATVTTVAAAAAASVAAVATASSSKKLEPAKKTSAGKLAPTAATKSKPTSDGIKRSADNKKPTTFAAKSTIIGASRPRTAPSASANKTSGKNIEKKTSTNLTAAASTTRPASLSGVGRKPIASNTTTTKTTGASSSKVGTTRPTTLSGSSKSAASATAKNVAAAAAKTAAPRLGTTARKLTTSNTAAPTHGTETAVPSKPQLVNGGAAKPMTLNIPAKPKPASSPRARPLSSQFTKTSGGLTPSGTVTKSPTKAAATSTTNGTRKSPSTINSTTANRTKTSAPTTKTFTARPAPKTTSTLTTGTSTTTRRSFGGTTKSTTNSSVQRKSSPSKSTTTAGGAKASPTKSNVSSKTKTKEVTTPKAAAKTAAETAANVLKEKQLNMTAEPLEPAKINGEPLYPTDGSNGKIEGTSPSSYAGENGMIGQKELALMDSTAA